jgi:hypothetical protein
MPLCLQSLKFKLENDPNSMIIVIKYRLLTSLPHHFNTTVAKNFPGYENATRKNIGRSDSQTGMKFLTRGLSPPELLTRGEGLGENPRLSVER